MSTRLRKSALYALLILGFVGLTAFAYADRAPWGGGYGYGGYGMGAGAYGCPAYGSNLSREQVDQLNAERNAFLNATRDLRSGIYQKRLELNQELAAQNPDENRVKALQNELSNLQARLDQDRVQHQIRMNKIAPNVAAMGPGFHHRGYAMGHGYYGRCGW